MRKSWISLIVTMFLACTVSTPLAADEKEAERVENSGKVMTEILNVPENIPQDLLNKASCVVVLPSVVKAARELPDLWPRGLLLASHLPRLCSPDCLGATSEMLRGNDILRLRN